MISLTSADEPAKVGSALICAFSFSSRPRQVFFHVASFAVAEISASAVVSPVLIEPARASLDAGSSLSVFAAARSVSVWLVSSGA